MSAWPSSLPVPLLAGYELQRQKSSKRTDMDSGSARMRKRFTRVPTFIPQSWSFTTKQFGLFEWWFDNTIDGGAAWFDAPQKNGTGMVTVQCRFMEGTYKAALVSNEYWQVTATLEVDVMPRISGMAAAEMHPEIGTQGVNVGLPDENSYLTWGPL